MTKTQEDGHLIKVDTIGRVRTAAPQREALLDGYEMSGLSRPEFAAQNGVKYPTFNLASEAEAVHTSPSDRGISTRGLHERSVLLRRSLVHR